MSDDENFPLSERSPSSEIQTRGGQQIPNFNENQENNQENQDINRIKVGGLDGAENINQNKSSFESKTKLKVHFKGWNGVASWKWIANDDTCGICRVAFDGCCPDCKLPGDDCPLVWGACTHCFHIHCIMKWLNAQQVQHLCPMCRQDWKFKES